MMAIEPKDVGTVLNVNFNILLKQQLYCASVGK